MSRKKLETTLTISNGEADIPVTYAHITDKRLSSGMPSAAPKPEEFTRRLTDEEDREEAEWQALFVSSEEMLIEMANRAEEEYHAGLTWPIDPETA